MYMINSRPTFYIRHQENCSNCESILELDATCLVSHKNINYISELANFEKLNSADSLIICNKNKPLSTINYLDILFALMRGKTIIMLDVPQFKPSTFPFIKDVILNRLSKIHVMDITLFDAEDMNRYLSSFTKEQINFSLTKHERTLVRSILKQHFQALENA